jgi:hypothetical protein
VPRAKKTLAGGQGQPVQSISGQTYGEGVQQEQLQKTMPAPQLANPQTQPTVPSPQQQETPTPSAPMQEQPKMSLDDMKGMLSNVGGQLYQPDDQPSVPFNTGLATGPFPSLNAYGASPSFKQGEFMRRLSRETGNPIFSELAMKAGI